MKRAQRAALLDVATPATPEEILWERHARIEREGLLELAEEVAIADDVMIDDLIASAEQKPRDARERVWARAYVERRFSTPQLAEIFGVSDDTVRRALHRLDILPPSRRPAA